MFQATHAIQLDTAIAFLPTLLNQLFSLLVLSPSNDVGLNIIRLLVHLVHLVQEANRADILTTYVKVFTLECSRSYPDQMILEATRSDIIYRSTLFFVILSNLNNLSK